MHPVDKELIEGLVRRSRHPVNHYGTIDREEQNFFILHSWECLNSGIDLTECQFSGAFDAIVDDGLFFPEDWPDGPVRLLIDSYGYLNFEEE